MREASDQFTPAQVATLDRRDIDALGVPRRRIFLRTIYDGSQASNAAARAPVDAYALCPMIDSFGHFILLVLPDGSERWCDLELRAD